MTPLWLTGSGKRVLDSFCQSKFGITPLWDAESFGRPKAHNSRVRLLRANPVKYPEIMLWHRMPGRKAPDVFVIKREELAACFDAANVPFPGSRRNREEPSK